MFQTYPCVQYFKSGTWHESSVYAINFSSKLSGVVTYIDECIKQREGEFLSHWPYQLRVRNVSLSSQSFTRIKIIATFLDEP
jgi:hypothetical protein